MNAVLATLKSHLGIAKSQLDLINDAPCLERCNTVVVFPETGLTISTDQHGRPVIHNAILATQFAPETANEICAQVTNGRGEHPQMMTPKEYYKLQVNHITETIRLFETPEVQ